MILHPFFQLSIDRKSKPRWKIYICLCVGERVIDLDFTRGRAPRRGRGRGRGREISVQLSQGGERTAAFVERLRDQARIEWVRMDWQACGRTHESMKWVVLTRRSPHLTQPRPRPLASSLARISLLPWLPSFLYISSSSASSTSSSSSSSSSSSILAEDARLLSDHAAGFSTDSPLPLYPNRAYIPANVSSFLVSSPPPWPFSLFFPRWPLLRVRESVLAERFSVRVQTIYRTRTTNEPSRVFGKIQKARKRFNCRI